MIAIIKKTILLTIFLLAALLVACDAQPTTETSEEEQEAAQEETTPQEEQETAPEDTGSLNDLQDELQEAFMNFATQQANYKVEYDMTMQMDGSNQDMTMTWYMMGPQNTRIDSQMNVEGMDMESRSYVREDEVVSCTRQQGSWNCFSVSLEEYEEEDTTSFTSNVEGWEEEAATLNFLGTSTRTIAGEEATCFTFNDGFAEQELCYADTGALLYMRFEHPEGRQVMQATSYTTRVSASDFEPPAEPQSMDDMIAGMMGDGFDPSDYGY